MHTCAARKLAVAATSACRMPDGVVGPVDAPKLNELFAGAVLSFQPTMASLIPTSKKRSREVHSK